MNLKRKFFVLEKNFKNKHFEEFSEAAQAQAFERIHRSASLQLRYRLFAFFLKLGIPYCEDDQQKKSNNSFLYASKPG